MSKKKNEVLWNPLYILLNIVNILTNLGFSMVTTTISKYSTEICGASLAVAGTVASIFSFAALLSRPFSGYIVDRFNKKNIYIVSTALFGAVVYGFAFAKSVPMLFVFRILQGILFGVSTTCSMTMVRMVVPKNRVSEGLGYFNAGIMVGQAVGPTIAVALMGSIGYQWMYILVATSITLPPFLFVMGKLNEDVAVKSAAFEKKKFHFTLSDFIAKEFILYALVCGMFSFYNGICNAFMLFIGEERMISNISLFFTVCSAVLLLVRILAGKTSDRSSLTILVNGSLICTAVSMAMVGYGRVISVFLIASVLKALGQGVGHVSLQGEALKKADPMHIGAAASTMYIGNDIGNTLGPIVGGVVAEMSGYASVFLVSIAIVAVSFVAFNIYQKKIQYQKPQEIAE